MQVPLFWQGLCSKHSSTSTVQVLPVNPGGHLQRKVPLKSSEKHDPPLRHGWGAQWSGNSHLWPGSDRKEDIRHLDLLDNRLQKFKNYFIVSHRQSVEEVLIYSCHTCCFETCVAAICFIYLLVNKLYSVYNLLHTTMSTVYKQGSPKLKIALI